MVEEAVAVGAASGKNHLLGKNPKTTVCGQFKPEGWPAPHPDGEMCVKCVTGNARAHRWQLPDTLGGIVRK